MGGIAGRGFPLILSTSCRRVSELPCIVMWSNESRTNGCYQSLSSFSPHLEQHTDGASLLRILLETLTNEIGKIGGKMGGCECWRRLHRHLLHDLERRATAVGMLAFGHFQETDSERPHVTLQYGFPFVHLGSHVPRCTTNRVSFGCRML